MGIGKNMKWLRDMPADKLASAAKGGACVSVTTRVPIEYAVDLAHVAETLHADSMANAMEVTSRIGMTSLLGAAPEIIKPRVCRRWAFRLGPVSFELALWCRPLAPLAPHENALLRKMGSCATFGRRGYRRNPVA